MEYKRLTEKDWHKEKFYPTTNNERVIRKRLLDLENKIENGTLVEIPTQEFVFHISKSKNGNYVVREISKYYYMSVYACTDGIMNKWFLTREEAEKRLEELKNG